jgi:hypothetical protein
MAVQVAEGTVAKPKALEARATEAKSKTVPAK